MNLAETRGASWFGGRVSCSFAHGEEGRSDGLGAARCPCDLAWPPPLEKMPGLLCGGASTRSTPIGDGDKVTALESGDDRGSPLLCVKGLCHLPWVLMTGDGG
jgi:hypothetical protein